MFIILERRFFEFLWWIVYDGKVYLVWLVEWIFLFLVLFYKDWESVFFRVMGVGLFVWYFLKFFDIF